MPLRVSCPGPVLRLFSSGGVGPVPSSPCLAWGRSPPYGLACSHKLALRPVGAARGRPGGALLAWVRGVRGWALSHARPPVFGACGRGPLPTGCECGGCGRGNVSPTPQGALLQAGFARCGGGTRAPGGWSLASVWGIRGWALSHAQLPVLGACGRGPLPTGCGCGGRPRGDLSPNPQRALLRAGFARFGGGTRAPRGGVSLACVWGVRGLALSDARPPVLEACGRGPLPTGCRCWGGGRGDPSPTPKRALLRAGFARCGGGNRAPVGGGRLPGCGASGVGRSPTPNCPSLGRAARARYALAVGARAVGVGTCHQPHSERSCELALRPVGRHEGARGGGGRRLLARGASGVGRSSSPDCPSLRHAVGAGYPLAAAGGM